MTLTVAELMAELQKHPQDSLVVLSSDREGNRYSPLAAVDDGLYVAETTSRGDIYLPELTDALRAEGYGEDDLYDGDDGKLAVVFYPIS